MAGSADYDAQSERISETAWFTAYMRSFSDIPYSSEILRELESIIEHTRTVEQRRQFDSLRDPKWAPKFEARFKLISRLLDELQADQVFEVAAGFSSRSFEMAKSSRVTYVEMDLPGASREKRRIVERLQVQTRAHFKEGDVFHLADLQAATRLFQRRPIAIVCEGLLRFLDLGQKMLVAKNVRQILEHFGGVWIWSDSTIGKKEDPGLGNAMIRRQEARVSQMTGVDITQTCFENASSAIAFYEGLGFAVQGRVLSEIAHELVSPKKLRIPPSEVTDMLGKETLYVTRLR